MGYQASFIEQEMAVDGVPIVNINPFAQQGEKDRRVRISENDAPVVVLQLFIRIDDEGVMVNSAFCEFLCNDHAIAIICGDHLHIVEIASCRFRLSFSTGKPIR